MTKKQLKNYKKNKEKQSYDTQCQISNKFLIKCFSDCRLKFCPVSCTQNNSNNILCNGVGWKIYSL